MYHTDNLDGGKDRIHPVEGGDFVAIEGKALAVVSEEDLFGELDDPDIHLFRPDGDGIRYEGVGGKYAFTTHDYLDSTFKSDLLEYVQAHGYEVTNIR